VTRYRLVAYQLTVTRRGASSVEHRAPNERELSNPGFNGKKTQQNERYRH